MNDYEYLKRSYYLQVTGNPKVWNGIILFIVFIVISFFTWAFYTEIEEVSYATGKIIPSDNIIKIQHHESAEVLTLNVKNGQQVKRGDILIEFNNDVYNLMIKELKNRLKGLKNRKNIYQQQLEIRKRLYKERLNSKITFLKIKNQLNDTEIEIGKLEKEISIIENKLDKSIIRSPIDGTIHNLKINSKDEVINGGVTILEVYPKKQALLAEIRISPKDIGHIKIEHDTTIKLDTYDYSRYGGIQEKLLEISKSTYIDENNEPFYKGHVSITTNKINNLLPIIPGMTLTAEIKTGKKNILEYLFKPVYYIKNRALTER